MLRAREPFLLHVRALLLLLPLLLLAGCATKPSADPAPPADTQPPPSGGAGDDAATPGGATPGGAAPSGGAASPAPAAATPAPSDEPLPTPTPPRSGASSGPRWFHGTFTEEVTDEDIHAVCRAAVGDGECLIMESFPPQYRFEFPTWEACEEARGRVLAVPHVADVTPCRDPRGHRLLGAYDPEMLNASVWQDAGRIAAAEGGWLTGVHRGFMVDEVDEGACARVRAALQARAYIATLGECRLAPKERPYEAPYPDGAPEDAQRQHSFAGTFRTDMEDGDIGRVCMAAQGNFSCTILTSLPPIFGFQNGSLAECEATRARVQAAVASVRGLTRCIGPAEFRVLGAVDPNATGLERDLVHLFAAANAGNARFLGDRFHADGFDAVGCERFLREFEAHAFDARVGPCERVPRDLAAGAPAPDASAAPGATWRFNATALTYHNDHDRAAFCEALGQPEGCGDDASFPPVYRFSFPTKAACDAARAKVLETWTVTGIAPCAPPP